MFHPSSNKFNLINEEYGKQKLTMYIIGIRSEELVEGSARVFHVARVLRVNHRQIVTAWPRRHVASGHVFLCGRTCVLWWRNRFCDSLGRLNQLWRMLWLVKSLFFSPCALSSLFFTITDYRIAKTILILFYKITYLNVFGQCCKRLELAFFICLYLLHSWHT